jgi:predicted dehydrogenase
MAKPVTAILIGAGQRGYEAYGPYALQQPDELNFVAVAEPNPERRARFAAAHDIPPERQYASWEPLLEEGRVADAALVTTLDRLHVGPAVAALEAGYHVLLEKPMATTLEGCVRLVQTAERTGRLLQICHVLRYAPFFALLHEVLESGRLGEMVTVEHRENVAYWHMAHSYVRGNWRSSEVESPMILAKCCHDLDILFWNLGAVRRLSSSGSLLHYRAENAPPGAPERCTDGCPVADECPWYAPRLYIDLVPLLRVARRSPLLTERVGATLSLEFPGVTKAARHTLPALERALDYREWPISVLGEDTSVEGRLEALRTGPYGRCVYHCDNDVVDHQVVSMELGNGGSAVLVMHGHSHREGRTLRYDGTRATLRGCYYANEQELEVHDHLTGKVELLRPEVGAVRGSGHGGGDAGLMRGFVGAVRGDEDARTTARESLESHLMAFAAEEARVEGSVIAMDDFRARAEGGTGE